MGMYVVLMISMCSVTDLHTHVVLLIAMCAVLIFMCNVTYLHQHVCSAADRHV